MIRNILIFMVIGGVLFGLRRLAAEPLPVESQPKLVVSVPSAATEAQVQAAIDGAVLTAHALRHGGAIVDPVVRERLLAAMHRSGSPGPDAELIDEAITLGLAQADPVARQRLQFHAEALLAAEVQAARPTTTDAQLESWVALHAARYATSARVSFEQVLFTRARRRDSAGSDASAELTRLQAAPDPRPTGDPSSLPIRVENATATEVLGRFGASFEARVTDAPVGQWTGPISSSFGWHLVRVHARTPGSAFALADVQARVRADYDAEDRAQGIVERLRAIRREYDVRLERTAP